MHTVVETTEAELELQDRLTAARIELAQAHRAKDSAYTERNRLVHALCSIAQLLGWRCGMRVDEGEGRDPAWQTVVMIDLPTGQVSWHIHESEVAAFKDLPSYSGPWDGHSTEEKYRRLKALQALPSAKMAKEPFSVLKNFGANGAPCAEETK
jgi:hypothetical protein